MIMCTVEKITWMFNHVLHCFCCLPCSNSKWQAQLGIRKHSTPDERHTQHMPKGEDKQYLLFGPRDGQILVQQMREPEVGQVRWSEGFWAKQEVEDWGVENRCVQRQRGKVLQVSQKGRRPDGQTNRNSWHHRGFWLLRLLSYLMLWQEDRGNPFHCQPIDN